jgi:trypsin
MVAWDYVLTAAHCYSDALSVVIDQQRYQIEQVIRHPDFNPSNYENDIMLLKLQGPVKATPGLDYLRLNFDGNKPDEGDELVAIGLGATGDSAFSTDLQEVTVDAIDPLDCSERYREIRNVNKDLMLCAARAGKDACHGDSGGPLVQKSTGLLCGIVSWGNRVCRGGSPWRLYPRQCIRGVDQG